MRVVQRNPSSLFSSRYAVDVTSYFRDIRARLSIPIIARIVRKLETYLQPEIYANGSPRLYASSIVLFYAFLQLPLHLYSVIALRATNQSLLEGDSENAWGFGQVVALVMVLATLTECWKGVKGQ